MEEESAEVQYLLSMSSIQLNHSLDSKVASLLIITFDPQILTDKEKGEKSYLLTLKVMIHINKKPTVPKYLRTIVY